MALRGDLDVTEGEAAVTFTFAVTNRGDDSVDLRFPNGQVADVTVRDGELEVWRWGEGRMFTQAVRTERLAPGQRLVRELTWPTPTPGEYEAEATLTADEAEVDARASFAV